MDQFKIDTTWYYVPSHSTDRQPLGPCSVDDLTDMFDNEEIDPDTLVCEQRERQWIKLRDHQKLFSHVAAQETTHPAQQQERSQSEQKPGARKEGVNAERMMPPQRAPNNAEVQFDEVRATYVYYDQKEGIHFEWDAEKKAWIPVIEDIVDQHQAMYKSAGAKTMGLSEKRGKKRAREEEEERGERGTDSEKTKDLADAGDAIGEDQEMQRQLQAFLSATADTEEQKKQQMKQRKKKRRTSEAGNVPKTLSVYVSNLPPDVTMEEMETVFKKGGLIREDPETRESRIKLYRDKSTNEIKGDALVTYVRPESVDLAVQLLDGTELRPEAPTGRPIKVERARFNTAMLTSGLATDRDSSEISKRKIKPVKSKEQQKKEKRRLDKQLGWDFTEDRFGGQPRTVILKHMFKPSDFTEDPNFGPELKQEIKEEIEDKVGHVDRVRVFDNHPDGVVEVRFGMPAHAQQCIDLMNDRWFGGQRITCEMYDGVTNYVVKESVEEQMARLERFTTSMAENAGDSEEIAK